MLHTCSVFCYYSYCLLLYLWWSDCTCLLVSAIFPFSLFQRGSNTLWLPSLNGWFIPMQHTMTDFKTWWGLVRKTRLRQSNEQWALTKTLTNYWCFSIQIQKTFAWYKGYSAYKTCETDKYKTNKCMLKAV